MCGGGSDPFPAVTQATGMQIVEIIGAAAVFAAPLGFAISLIAGAVLLTGRGRRLSFAALLAALASGALLLWAAGPYNLGYTTKRAVESLSGLMALAGFFAIYLRHTYAPTSLKWVNLPATLGFAATLALTALLVFMDI